jgi:hypothetical protein
VGWAVATGATSVRILHTIASSHSSNSAVKMSVDYNLIRRSLTEQELD